MLAVLALAVPAAWAQDPQARCEALFARDPDSRESAKCFGDLAATLPAATTRLRELVAANPNRPWLQYYLATSLWSSKDPAAAQLYLRAAELFAQRDQSNDEVTARIGRFGFLFQQLHRFEEAEVELDLIADAARISGSLVSQARCRREQARFQRQRKLDLEAADQLLRQDEELIRNLVRDDLGAKEADVQDLVRFWFLERLAVSQELGRSDEVSSYAKLALEASKQLQRKLFEARVRYFQAIAFIDVASPTPADREQAIEQAQAALAAGRQASDVNVQAVALRLLGKLSRGDEGRAYLAECLELPEVGESTLCRSALAGELAHVDPERAQRLLDEAETATRSVDAIHVRTDRLRLSWATAEPEQAIATSLAVLDKIEALRDKQLDEGSRADVLAAWLDPYAILVGHLLARSSSRQDLELAWEVSERMRGRVLLEQLAAQRRHSTPAVEQARQDQGIKPEKTVSLRELEGELAADQALLAFQLAAEQDLYEDFAGGSWLAVVTRGRTRVYRLQAEPHQVHNLVRTLIGMSDPADGTDLLGWLSQHLLAKALQELPADVRRLAIVPDGALHQLPFALLRTGSENQLVQRYQLTVVPSATLWRQWQRQQPPPAAIPALVLANPNLVQQGATAQPDRTASCLRGELGPLPHAEAEGRAVIRRLGDSGQLRLGSAASEAFLSREPALSRFAVLHFAAHACVDTRTAEHSAVFLTPGEGENGRLQPAEIAQLDLAGRLVVLAACDSATGEVLRGEGVMGLARAFFQADARTVVGSLWRLPDQEAMKLFDVFYRHLGAGQSVAAALARAQQERLAAGAPTTAWAAPVVLGDGDLVPFPGGRPPTPQPPWYLHALALATLAVLGLALRRQFHPAQQRG